MYQINQNFSIQLACKLDHLAEEIAKAIPTADNQPKEEINYFQALESIKVLVNPLFEKIVDLSKKAGFEKVEKFEAAPKGACENFLFAILKDEKVAEVVLAKNKKYGFLQMGGGKTMPNESCSQAAHREAQEEFSFTGKENQLQQITIESESGMPIFHFVKGVHLAYISPEQAEQLKLSDDMANNSIERLPVEEFLKITDNDSKPIDHGFDRKWIAEAIRDQRTGTAKSYYKRSINDDDHCMADKALDWMQRIRVNSKDIENIQSIIGNFVASEWHVDSLGSGNWKSPENRETVKKSAQKVVDAMVERLLPQWTFQGKKGEEVGTQVKVQEAASVYVNGELIPSFLTISQMVALQNRSIKKQEFEITSVSRISGNVNILTK